MLSEAEKQRTLQAYSRGNLTTRAAIEAIGACDYADLIIALAQRDLKLPRKSAGAEHVRRATEILQPLLQPHAV